MAKSEKRLGEFLKENQEPFILQVYLLERGYPKRWNNNNKSNKKKRKTLVFPFSKLMTAAALHVKKLSSSITHSRSNRTGDHVNNANHTIADLERFSSASSSTVFHSCSDFDEDRTSSSSHKDKLSFSAETFHASSVCSMGPQSQQATNNGKHRQRCLEGIPLPQFQNNEMLWNQRYDSAMEQSISSCSVLAPKNITEDSLLSAALWSLLIDSTKKESYGYRMELRDIVGPNVSQVLKSKGVLHKTKQLLFDCIREIRIASNKQVLMESEELGRIICQRTKEWGQQAGDETNLTCLLTLDYTNSIPEWSKFEPHLKDINADIADAILERVKDEIVSDMTEFLPTTVY